MRLLAAFAIAVQSLAIAYLVFGRVPHGTAVYILPEGFTGTVALSFRPGHGVRIQPDRYGTGIYRIPDSGILYVDAAGPPSGWHYTAVFYEKADGSLMYLPDDGPPEAIRASVRGSGRIEFHAGQALRPPLNVTTFYVGNREVGAVFPDDALIDRILREYGHGAPERAS